MVQLPRFAALKSKYNHKYLRFVHETCTPIHTFLQYSSQDILSTPYTKFELEKAECDPSLYHIRCCYNNKYWCSWSSDHHFIVAGADQKQEDKSKWTCTLFRPVYDKCHQSFRFCHVYLGFNVVLWRVGPPYGECLRAQWSDPDRDLCDLSTIITWESPCILPKYVAFKGVNGSYLRVHLSSDIPYLQFASKDIEDPTTHMETFTTDDGKTRIKSNHLDKFWRRDNSNYILVDCTDSTPQDPGTLFSPTQVSSTVVTLCNLGNDKFVKRYTFASKINFLNAVAKEIDVESHLRVVELVVSREINYVEFRPCTARIYGQTVVALATVDATNKTRVPKKVKVSLSYVDARSSTWTSTITKKLPDVKTTIKSRVPIIIDENIYIQPTISCGDYKWGEAITTSKTEVKTYEVTVPPMSIITVALSATKGSCDVPFSYNQVDILIRGKTEVQRLYDGVYHGTNYYNFKHETNTTKPIPDGGCAKCRYQLQSCFSKSCNWVYNI